MKVKERLFIHDNIGFVELVSHTNTDLALSVTNSARISHNKTKDAFDEKDTKLVKYLYENEHTSPFRHYYLTFHLKLPLFVARQWTKYQVGSTWRTFEIDGSEVKIDLIDEMYDTDKGCSWNEVSGRYTQLKPEFYIPDKFRSPVTENKQGSEVNEELDHKKLKEYYEALSTAAYLNYLSLLDVKVAKEQARMILPQNIYSESYWTVSLQAVLHFLHQRLKPEAQYEIRMYALLIKDLISEDLKRLGIWDEV